ncbi:E3 ubiquitin-protein ligase listerin [Ananas comosus]|uniref:E3 ubiquitin-protein ligase listerin n=1 Tax=Ananas comosus TaxID=4615 RepID=A0A199V9A9_ANACO|nr:E3 ubiquitin-protein ligase listerin [Ananas comosus]
MGPWWFSQFDPTPEVSQAARHSFEAAFPASERRLDALMLCVKEIFLYLDENLKLTPQALSDKATPLDELEDMHQRVISSSLLAAATLVDILLGGKLQCLDDENIVSEQKNLSKVRTTTISSAENMFSQHKYFLDFLKSKNPMVRSATYSVLTSYIKHIPHAFNEGSMKVTSPAILGAFQEKDASCHFSMWDMILNFSRKFPHGWSHCNAQKVVLNRFLHFLRNGCYGSKQTSYPVLTLFLESIPIEAVAWEHFVFEFLQNLWAGRNPQHSSAADSSAFFSALKQCFLWVLYNSSRISTEGDVSDRLSLKLVNDILSKLLWRDYLLLGSAENDSRLSDESSARGIKYTYPSSYLQALGRCIVEVLSDIFLNKYSLFNPLCTSFWKDCLEILQQRERLIKFHEHAEQIVGFFVLLDELVPSKGQTWPLDCLARPLVTNSFHAIRSTDTPDVVRLLSVLSEIFGPVNIFSNIANTTDSSDEESKMKNFLQAFNDVFIPWCLDGNSRSSSLKLDLLLALIQEEYFIDQWYSIISFATEQQIFFETDVQTSQSFDQIEVLALLFEKVRERIGSNKSYNLQKNGSQPEHWRHKLLDSAAISIAYKSHSRVSDARFLRAVLGGSVRDDQICFLSREAVIIVLRHILKSLTSVLTVSTFGWAKFSCSLLFGAESENLMHSQETSLSTRYEMARFAFEVLEGSIFCLKIIEEEYTLVPSILAALFIIDWESSMVSSLACEDNGIEFCKDAADVSQLGEETYPMLTLGGKISAFRSKMGQAFWTSLNLGILSRLGNILVQTIRFAVFETSELSSDRVADLCSQWVLNVLQTICHNHTQLQILLDNLLTEGESWPFWVRPFFHDKSRSASLQYESVRIFKSPQEVRHARFVSFVDKLISSLGASKLIVGIPETPHSMESSSVEIASSYSFSRAWLAAEMLCSWKWQGGSALRSFLPSLISNIKSETLSHGILIMTSIVDILLDGAVMNGTRSRWIFFDAWSLSDDEVEKIQDNFLRALVTFLLSIYVKDKLWRKCDALAFFERLTNVLFSSATVNRPYLRVVPFILSVIIPELFRSSEYEQSNDDDLLRYDLVNKRSSEYEQFNDDDPLRYDLVNKSILNWLQTAISCHPVGSGESSEEDPEDWFQLVLSCYPLRMMEKVAKYEVELQRDISHPESSLLLSLFRKYQKLYEDTAASAIFVNGETISKSVQMIGAKLTAVSVGYCWQEFEESDWTFVLDRSHRWIESSVLLMEEIAENIDEAVINYRATAELEATLEKLSLTVHSLDPLPISIANAALIILCLLSKLVELQKATTPGLERWADTKDRMMGSILRLFFATGVAEAIASSCSEEASSVVASNRRNYTQFWGLVASFVTSSPHHVISSAMESMELWGLSKGSVSSLYAILFSSQPISSMQFAAYTLLTYEPICQLSLVKESSLEAAGSTVQESDFLKKFESPLVEPFCLRDEISFVIHKPTAELLEMDLISQDRVNFFIAWALLLTHLNSLPSSSTARERLIQYVQDSVSSAILDCLFQHIPLKKGTVNAKKKKDAELVPEASSASSASVNAISKCYIYYYVESLWPTGAEQMASLAGALYGMMIRLLPSYVRNWFSGLRDRSLSSAVEAFTKEWCSPPLLMDELSKVKEIVVADENFSVTVSKSAYEIVATYKKEETGMDLVIRLPNCYPLRPVDVECTRSLGISEVKQRKWLLSLTAFVRNQNGAIAEAICTWKSNFDQEFEGVEECPICYSIIHTTNHSIPRLACKTCKHKFHSACLYKWFSTSHKSTCPLCQTPF